MSRSVSFIEKFEHRDERNMKNLILVFMELVQDQVVKRGVATMDLVMKVMVEEVEKAEITADVDGYAKGASVEPNKISY